MRASTHLQIYSIGNQLAAIEAFCAAEGLDLVEVYSDAGLSGLTLKRRPGLLALIAEAHRSERHFDAVVVYDVSRWGRFQDVDESAYHEQELRNLGVRILYCAEAFSNDDSMGSTILKAVRRAMAAEYSRDLARKITNGARRAAARGFRCGGTAGYGYRRAIFDPAGKFVSLAQFGEWKALSSHHTKLVLGPPEEAEAVRRVFALYAAGEHNLNEIAEQMIAEGRPPPQPGGWWRLRIRAIVSNEKYVGTVVWGKTTAPFATRLQHRPPATWTSVPHAHPAIVSKALFERAQRRLKRGRSWPTREVFAALRHLFATYGTVTNQLISRSALLPTLNHMRKRFGTVQNAILAAGLPFQTHGRRREITNALRKVGVDVNDPRRPRWRPPGSHNKA